MDVKKKAAQSETGHNESQDVPARCRRKDEGIAADWEARQTFLGSSDNKVAIQPVHFWASVSPDAVTSSRSELLRDTILNRKSFSHHQCCVSPNLCGR